MFNLIINFCVFVFIFYAMGNSARVILFGSKRKKRACSHGRAVRRRKAKVIKLNARTTKRPLRKKPQRLFVLNRFKASPNALALGNSPVRGNVAKRQKGCRFRQKKVSAMLTEGFSFPIPRAHVQVKTCPYNVNRVRTKMAAARAATTIIYYQFFYSCKTILATPK